uniref:ataxin-3-like n=1 Tax=Asterias amurensis TaxID=7602 RepID=UPI003AB4092C
MDAIFHERQEGSLCAQHCLNSLLQGPYFSAVDLADIGRDLDEAERATMAEGDINSPEYLRFIQQPSSNMDDSGYFSIQVIGRAMKVWSLDLLPFGSTEAVEANIHPEREKAFICNFKDHWLTIRKIGRQWFNLNSLLTGPELISDTYLAMFLIQLQKEGYSLFVVRGTLPDNEADQLLNLIPVIQTIKPRLLSDLAQQQTPASTSTSTGESSSGKRLVSLEDLHNALQASQSSEARGTARGERLCSTLKSDNSQGLADAMKLSMQGMGDPSVDEKVDPEDLRRKRQAFFDRQQNQETRPSQGQVDSLQGEGHNTPAATHPHSQVQAGQPVLSEPTPEETNPQEPGAIGHSLETKLFANDDQMTEEAMLEIAIQMSLGGTQKLSSVSGTELQPQHGNGS